MSYGRMRGLVRIEGSRRILRRRSYSQHFADGGNIGAFAVFGHGKRLVHVFAGFGVVELGANAVFLCDNIIAGALDLKAYRFEKFGYLALPSFFGTAAA